MRASGVVEHVAPAHDVYAERLAWLERPDALVSTVASWREGEWRRVYGRFMPFAEPFATLVFERSAPEQTFVTVDVFRERPTQGGDLGAGPSVLPDATSPNEVAGWLRLTPFPQDRRLPTLAEALAVSGGVSVVRYRPQRRCTFRVTDEGRTRFVKVFADDSGLAVHQAGAALSEAWRQGELGFAVADPIEWNARTRALSQGAVQGTPLLDRLSTTDAVPLAHRMGAALGTLASSTLQPTTRFDSTAQCARSTAYVRELVTRVPALAVEARSLGEGLVALHRRRPGRVCPIHGAPHVNQWLAQGDQLALVDFDRFSAGNPELDVATFLGELDFEEALTTPVSDIGAAFTAGYESTGGALDPQLLAAYRAHKRLAKALRSARALRVDGAARAHRHLALATAALAGQGAA